MQTERKYFPLKCFHDEKSAFLSFVSRSDKMYLLICLEIKMQRCRGSYLSLSHSVGGAFRLTSIHQGVVILTCVIVPTRICLKSVKKEAFRIKSSQV